MCTGCGSFGLEEEPNEWALACDAVQTALVDDSEQGANDSAEQLVEMIATYGGGERGEAFRVLVDPVVDGLDAGDRAPARAFAAANC